MLNYKADVLHYRNEAIIQRYEKDYPSNVLSGDEALSHLLQYFWLSQKHAIDLENDPQNIELHFQVHIYNEMSEIDDMWHTFLLFTKDYAHFCNQYFGTFIHHIPNTHEVPYDPALFEEEFRRFLSYAYDHLGEDTVKQWFSELLCEPA